MLCSVVCAFAPHLAPFRGLSGGGATGVSHVVYGVASGIGQGVPGPAVNDGATTRRRRRESPVNGAIHENILIATRNTEARGHRSEVDSHKAEYGYPVHSSSHYMLCSLVCASAPHLAPFRGLSGGGAAGASHVVYGVASGIGPVVLGPAVNDGATTRRRRRESPVNGATEAGIPPARPSTTACGHWSQVDSHKMIR